MLELYPNSSIRARGKCEGRKSLNHSLSFVVHVASAESPMFDGFKPWTATMLVIVRFVSFEREGGRIYSTLGFVGMISSFK